MGTVDTAPLNGEIFRVTAPDRETVLGEDNAVVAADLLAAKIPQNCESAVHGTAEDLEPLATLLVIRGRVALAASRFFDRFAGIAQKMLENKFYLLIQ